MSDILSTDTELCAIAGALAGGVAGELARPIRELREMLAVAVDSLDHHVSQAKGPTPYSWKQVGAMRERLAEAYQASRRVARLAADLSSACNTAGVVAPIDVTKTIEAALNIARHRVAEQTEVYIDYGAVPAVRAVDAPLILALAQLISAAAEQVAGSSSGEVHIQSRREDDCVILRVWASGGGGEQSGAALLDQARHAASAAGVAFESIHGEDEGPRFELRLAIGTPR